FRTTPLWGLGTRLFFLHDGRTSDLLAAIQAHFSTAFSDGGSNPAKDNSSFTYPPSEANGVILLFNALPENDNQPILDFLRSFSVWSIEMGLFESRGEALFLFPAYATTVTLLRSRGAGYVRSLCRHRPVFGHVDTERSQIEISAGSATQAHDDSDGGGRRRN